jgi:TetR/AcrR family transcriptional regulator, repressor of fatR-cypB operon
VDKKLQIIHAAMKLLIANGVQATPMSAIAREANTGMGTIYNYYATKEELINAIYIFILWCSLKRMP